METTTKTNYPDEIISAGQLLRILDSDAREISALCHFGNIYFSKSDVDVLRKVKELYEHTKRLQEEKRNSSSNLGQMRENKLKKIKDELKPKFEKMEEKEQNVISEAGYLKSLPAKSETMKVDQLSTGSFLRKLDSMETNVISRITDVLSEKLDGLDEVIVELIKAKTENETLRQKVNELNKENFTLKSENASYKPVGLGFYVKKSTDDFTF